MFLYLLPNQKTDQRMAAFPCLAVSAIIGSFPQLMEQYSCQRLFSFLKIALPPCSC
jgi:hypothetical protein